MRKRRRVVITGIGVVSPIGIGKDTFWRNLIAGKSGVDWITAFDPSPYPCKVAAEVRDLNPKDFMSSRSARTMGRFSHFAVSAARLAMSDSGLSIKNGLAERAAVCFGSSGGAEIFESAANQLVNLGLPGVSPSHALEYPPHTPSAHVSIELGLRGQVVSVSSNCCTGLDAIHAARTMIESGSADVAVAGSCEAPLFPTSFATFCALGALSRRTSEPSRASRPYDLMRDGLVIGEGAAALILEDSEHADRRGVAPYALVKGFSGASEAIDMRKGDQTGQVMALALSHAVQSAGISPTDIDHVNAHGSSLPDFDVCDSNAFKLALGSHAYRIPIASIKSMIGQPFAAAGSFQVAAACLSLKHQRVPPTINQDVPDPRCDLDYVPNKSRAARVRHVLVNAHSFGGGCAAMVLGQTLS
jgi:3-oxoacyl-[acyl-carrier-protein] synthase II